MARYDAGGRKICGGENIMMIVLGHFLIAAAAVIATSAIIGYFLTKLLLRLLQKVDRSIRLYRGKINRSGQNCLRRNLRYIDANDCLVMMPLNRGLLTTQNWKALKRHLLGLMLSGSSMDSLWKMNSRRRSAPQAR
jgi:hypothetical protein